MADNQGNTRAELVAALVTKSWQDDNFKRELMDNPRDVIQRETGKEIPSNVQVTILEETASQIYFVIPNKPEIDTSEELSDEALEAVAGGGFVVKKKNADGSSKKTIW